MKKEKTEIKEKKDNSKKVEQKEERKSAKLALHNEKKEITEQIKKAKQEKKFTKDKEEKKKINKDIKKLKNQKNKIGKKDTYFNDVMEEMKLVRWPSKMEVVKYSIACLLFVLFFAIFFYGFDALFSLVKDLID